MRKSRRFPLVLLLIPGSILPGSAEIRMDVEDVSGSIVRVRAYGKGQVAAEGGGFVVNEAGHVLTNAHLLEGAERVTVSPLKTGAEVEPEQLFAHRETNLALLRAPGLGLPPLRLSEKGADAGRAVRTLRLDVMGHAELSRGTIGAYETIFDRKAGRALGRLVQHNALTTAKAFGMPLFNECGDVVGINMPNPRGGPWPFRTARPKGTVYALSSKSMVAALDDRQIACEVADAECLSALERADRDRLAAVDSLERARAQADSARKAAREAEERGEAARREAERAKARADAAAREAAESIQAASARVESLKAAAVRADSPGPAPDSPVDAQARAESLETGKARADSATGGAAGAGSESEEVPSSLKWGIPIGGGLVLLALLGWLLASSRRREQLRSAESRLGAAEEAAEAARRAAAAAPRPAPFRCHLEGRDGSGRPFALTLSALALSDPAGVTLGRRPAVADFVIDHEEVSREHVRLRCSGSTLFAEDLEALNGTKVNGRLLSPKERAALRDGDRLEVGPVAFSVRLVQE